MEKPRGAAKEDRFLGGGELGRGAALADGAEGDGGALIPVKLWGLRMRWGE